MGLAEVVLAEVGLVAVVGVEVGFAEVVLGEEYPVPGAVHCFEVALDKADE